MTAETRHPEAAAGAPQRRRVAVMRLSALGDVAMALPLLYAACREYPEVNFVLVTKKAFTGLATQKPQNLTLLAADTKGRHKGPTGLLQLARDINCDDFVDLHDVLRSKVVRNLLRMGGARVTVFDKTRAAKRALTAKGAARAKAISPTTERYAQALEKAGYRVGELSPLPVNRSQYTQHDIPAKKEGEKWVGIAPSAAHAAKVYPIGQLHLAAKKLHDANPGLRIFLFGGRDEAPELEVFAHDLDRATVVAGKGLGFAGEIALMADLDVMVSMDSGNMHLAAATGASSVSIWGATHPAAGFGPVTCRPGQRHVFLQDNSLDCRPCSIFGNKPCRRVGEGEVPPCMQAVTPDMIAGAVTALLAD